MARNCGAYLLRTCQKCGICGACVLRYSDDAQGGMRMEIILVRHSIAQGNPERRFLGVTDTPLLPEGIALAERRTAAMPPVEHVYVSPLRRAKRRRCFGHAFRKRLSPASGRWISAHLRTERMRNWWRQTTGHILNGLHRNGGTVIRAGRRFPQCACALRQRLRIPFSMRTGADAGVWAW